VTTDQFTVADALFEDLCDTHVGAMMTDLAERTAARRAWLIVFDLFLRSQGGRMPHPANLNQALREFVETGEPYPVPLWVSPSVVPREAPAVPALSRPRRTIRKLKG
jgi:hypothetical protein